MARGEHSKARPQGSGLAIGGVFLVSCLAALTLVGSTRGCAGCSGCGPAWVGPPPVAFPGAPALGELGWRDASRGRPAWAAPTAPDAPAAERALDAALRARGYVETPRDPAAETARSLPFELRSDALDGACGVVVVLGVGPTTITSLDDADQGTVRASDPSVLTMARCGVGTLRAAGLGTAVVRTWLLPGITPADVARISLPADTVLAHAEAEAILRAHGLEPVDALARQAFPSGAAVVPPHRGATGCTSWVGVVEGGGRAETRGPTGLVGRDYALDRAMIGAAWCAGPPATETSTHLVDDGGDGVVVVWRPYRSPGGGPTRAPAAGSTVTTVGAAEVVPLADLSVSDAHPTTAPTP